MVASRLRSASAEPCCWLFPYMRASGRTLMARLDWHVPLSVHRVPRCTGCTPYMPPCDAGSSNVVAACRGAEARSRVSDQLFARGRSAEQAGQNGRQQSKQFFLFYTRGLLPASLPHALPVIRPIQGPPSPFHSSRPHRFLLLALSRLSSNSTPPPSRPAAGLPTRC